MIVDSGISGVSYARRLCQCRRIPVRCRHTQVIELVRNLPSKKRTVGSRLLNMFYCHNPASSILVTVTSPLPISSVMCGVAVQWLRACGTVAMQVLWEDNSKGHTSGLPKDAVVELWKEHKGDASVLDATIKAGTGMCCASRPFGSSGSAFCFCRPACTVDAAAWDLRVY